MRYSHKRKSSLAKRLLLLVGIPVVSLSVTFLLLYIFAPVRYSEPLPKLAQDTTTAIVPIETTGLPVRLEVPSLSVNATIKPVGLTVDGDMAIDNSIKDVAWYQLGPKPGEIGSAVIAGHYGWKDGVPSVFNGLHTLKAGDTLVVHDKDATETVFVVTSMRRYNPEDDATAVFTSNDGIAHLNLITCEGEWNNKQQTYSQRLVVFTNKVNL